MSVTIGRPVVMIPISRWDGPELAGERPYPLPAGWKYRQELEPEMTAFAHPNGLAAMVSVMIEQDGETWLHVSVSRADRMPTYADLCLAKRDLVGRFRKAIQVFPPETEHVNLHAYCLHLWAPLSHDSLPDFTRGNGVI